MLFKGNVLDKIAHTTSSAWPKCEYSPSNLRQLVAELGIVGRIRTYDENSGVVAVDFEYTYPTRLGLNSNDECAIQPLFYSKLLIKREQRIIVYPFPDHPEFDELVKS